MVIRKWKIGIAKGAISAFCIVFGILYLWELRGRAGEQRGVDFPDL